MKTGDSNIARFDLPQIFDVRVPGPIDSRMTISSLTAITTEIPIGARYLGQTVWVNDIKQFYYFKDGTSDIDFIPFTLDSANASYKFVFTSISILQNGDFLTHGLNTDNFIIQFFLDRKPIILDYEFLEFDGSLPTRHLNNIRLLPPIGYDVPIGLKAVITY